MLAASKTLLADNSGQGLMEYSLILFFIALAAAFALEALGMKILGFWEYAMSRWPG